MYIKTIKKVYCNIFNIYKSGRHPFENMRAASQPILIVGIFHTFCSTPALYSITFYLTDTLITIICEFNFTK